MNLKAHCGVFWIILLPAMEHMLLVSSSTEYAICICAQGNKRMDLNEDPNYLNLKIFGCL